MKILIVTDAWYPQVNGVVHTLDNTATILREKGHDVKVLSPEDFSLKFPLPGYSEIKLTVNLFGVGPKIWKYKPDAIHIATEGPLGWAARTYCQLRKIPFSTSYHTKFPEFVNARFPWIKEEWVYKIMRRFHRPSKMILVTTLSMQRELWARDFTSPMKVWSRGADTDLFHPDQRTHPIELYQQ